MASKRKFKKYVNILTMSLIDECLVYKELHPEYPGDKVDKLVKEIVENRNDLIVRLNQNVEEKEVKKHFHSIREDIDKLIAISRKLGK